MTNPNSNGANLGIIEPGATFGGLVNGLESGQLSQGSYGLNRELVYVMPEPGTVVELGGERLTFKDYRNGEMVWTDESGEETFTL